MSNASHCEVHTNFGAFAGEVCFEVSADICWNVVSNADNVFGSPGHFAFLLNELFSWCLALWHCSGAVSPS